MNKNLKILVVGGLSAGPAAVAKARRENESAEITLFEQGKNISYATCGMPYVLSGKIKTIDHLLVVQPELLSKRFNADVRLNEKVTDVDVRSKKLTTIKGTYEYDKLIWAAGARAVMPPIKGLDNAEYCSPFRSLKDLNRIRQSEKFQNAQKIAVIGAGLIGVEVVENLRKAGKEVILLEGGSQVLPQWSEMVAHVAKKEILNNGV